MPTKNLTKTSVVYAEIEGVKSTPATRVSQSAFDFAGELSDQLWDAVLAQVPPHVAALLNTHDELTTTLAQVGQKMQDDGTLSVRDLHEMNRLTGLAANLLAC